MPFLVGVMGSSMTNGAIPDLSRKKMAVVGMSATGFACAASHRSGKWREQPASVSFDHLPALGAVLGSRVNLNKYGTRIQLHMMLSPMF